MANKVIENTFSNVYRDDYSDSDNYYKILFNNGRALQVRELNQMQTILNEDIKATAEGSFRQGAAAVGGEIRVDNAASFVKLDTTSNSLPADPDSIEGEVFVESVSGIKVRIQKVQVAENLDPATIYVQYIDNGGADGDNDAISVTPGRTLTGETTGTVLTAQLTNTTANPAVGFGTLAFVNSGKFFINSHFVFTAAQNVIIAKYDRFGTDSIGFIVTEDVVTSTDDENLFDNSGPNLNRAAAGADRYRIQLTFTNGTSIAAGDYYIKLGEIDEGRLVKDTNEVQNSIGTIKKVFNTYNYEQAGNYAIRNFNLSFRTNPSDEAKIDVTISDGKAYVHGERIHFRFPMSVKEDKPRTTTSITDQNSIASYGNYVLAPDLKGCPTITNFDQVNLRSAITYGGSTVGTARVRAVEKDNSKYRIYLFDISMASGSNFGSVKSIGTGTTYASGEWNADLQVESTGVVEIKEKDKNTLFFDIPFPRPASFSDIELTVAKKITGQTTNGSGVVTISASAGHVFADTSSWIIIKEVNGNVDTNNTITNNGGTADISGLANSADYSIITYQTKQAGSIKTKTKTNRTATITPNGDGSVDLGRADVLTINEVRNATSVGTVITSRYNLDNGQRDNFYDQGKLLLKGGASSPSGDVYVDYEFFEHSASGDFFTAESYSGQVDYKDIPEHRQKNNTIINLREVLDFRPRKDNTGANFSGTGAQAIPLPRKNETVEFTEEFYLGVRGQAVISREGWFGVFLSDPAASPIYPSVPGETSGEIMKIAKFEWYPYMISDTDMKIEYIDNRRYTMRDVGVLDKRLSGLEEQTAMTMLELATNTIEVMDSDGINRFKAGITADPFNNHAFSDTGLDEYRASIDLTRGEARPSVNRESIELVYDSDLSTDTVRKGDLVLQKHQSDVIYLQQESASRAVTVNPFEVQKLIGKIKLSPSTDNWVDTVTLPEKIITGTQEITNDPSQSFTDHDTNWSGVLAEDESDLKVGDVLSSKEIAGDSYTTTEQKGHISTLTTYQKKHRSSIKVIGTSTRRENLGSFVRDQNSIPYARAKFISFSATGLRPNTRYFPYVNNVAVDDYVNATAGTGAFAFAGSLTRNSPYLDAGTQWAQTYQYPDDLGGPTTIITNGDGAVSGYLLLPNNATIQFPSGKMEFKLNDVAIPSTTVSLSYCDANFESTGILREVQDEILTTRIVQTAPVTSPLDPEVVNQIIIDTTPPEPPVPPTPPAPPVIPTPPIVVAPKPVRPTTPTPPKVITKPPAPTPTPVTPKPDPIKATPPAIEPTCFLPGTMVIMEDMTKKPISEIHIGDRVLGGPCKTCGDYCDNTDRGNTVINIETPVLGPRVVYGINGKNPFVSEEHPMMTTSGWGAFNVETLRKWEWGTYSDIVKEELKDIKDLKIGDVLITNSGTETIETLQMTEFPVTEVLYNLVLDGNNTYYAEDILVHNKCVGGGVPGDCGNAGPSPSCFVAGTEVTMADGSIKLIEDVKIGDSLLGKDGSVSKVFDYDHPKLGLRKLYGFNGGKAFVTAEHPFMTREGWKAIDTKKTIEENSALSKLMAGNIKVGDEIVKADGTHLTIESIEEHYAPNQQLYNFILEGKGRTYIADGMLVHNKGGGKVICTALYEMGMLSQDVYNLDSKFGLMVDRNDPALGAGYRFWATPVAEYIKGDSIGSKVALHIVAPLAKAWAEEMAHIMKPEDYKSNYYGKAIMTIGHPLSRFIGKLISGVSKLNLIKGNI